MLDVSMKDSGFPAAWESTPSEGLLPRRKGVLWDALSSAMSRNSSLSQENVTKSQSRDSGVPSP